jgi:hypothetical protein
MDKEDCFFSGEVCVIERNEGMLTNPRRLLDIDDFIENLWKVHVQVKSEGYVQVGFDDQSTQTFIS